MNITEKVEAFGKARQISTAPANSLEWLRDRQNSIGGSDIAAIMHRSPWTSELTLYCRKAGLLPEQEQTEAMRIGTYLEPAIIELYKSNHDHLTVHSNVGTWESRINSRWHANPDGIIETEAGDLSVLEIKYTTRYWSELPEYYRLQVMWYQEVLGLYDDAVVAVLSPQGYREFPVIHDHEEMRTIKLRTLEFLQLLDSGVMPDGDGSESTYQTTRQLNPHIKDEEVEIDADLYRQLIDSMAQENAHAARTRMIKSQILHSMKGARWGYVNGKQVVSLRARGEGLPYLQIEME